MNNIENIKWQEPYEEPSKLNNFKRNDIPCAMEAAAEAEYKRTGRWPVALCLVCTCPKCNIMC